MATGYTVTGGSTTVSVNVATTSFTITATGGAFNGTDSITIASTGGVITASQQSSPPAGGWVTDTNVTNNGSASVVVVPISAETNFTFVVRWATAGSKTVTYTNGQAWLNASDSSVTVLASGSYKKIGQSGVILLGGGISIVGK